MKPIIYILILCISSITFAQNTHVLKTDDGRRVLLKPDFTWEYIASDKAKNKPEPPKEKAISKTNKNSCQLPANYKEPRLDSKIQNKLKRGHATISDIKEKVAKDNNCAPQEVILLSATEIKSKGEYHFCVNGKKQAYKRIGNTIIKKGKLF